VKQEPTFTIYGDGVTLTTGSISASSISTNTITATKWNTGPGAINYLGPNEYVQYHPPTDRIRCSYCGSRVIPPDSGNCPNCAGRL